MTRNRHIAVKVITRKDHSMHISDEKLPKSVNLFTKYEITYAWRERVVSQIGIYSRMPL